MLYVSVVAGNAAYTSVLVGDGSATYAQLMTITMTATLLVAAALLALFWALFVRVRNVKQKGYKPVVA